MASKLSVDEVAAKNGTGPVTLTKQDTIKQWLHFDHENTTVDGSFNTSSVVDDATGSFSPVLTNAMSSADDRCIVALSNHDSSDSYGRQIVLRHDVSGDFTASKYQLETFYGNDTVSDQRHNMCMVSGDLA
jgi:hypothetical protein